MNLKNIEKFIDSRKVSFISSIDINGFPTVKAMLPPRKRIGLKTFYFSTNTSSRSVDQYRNNPQASIYFYEKSLKYIGLMLIGTIEVLEDQEIKNMLWNPEDRLYYPKGVTDPDYCVLKFNALKARYYCNLKTIDLELEKLS